EGLYFLPYQLNVFHQIASAQLLKAGVKLLLNTTLKTVQLSAGQVVELGLYSNTGLISLTPETVIDCSGNAQVSTLAGLEVIKQQYYQSAAFVFQVNGLPQQLKQDVLSLNFIRWIKRGIDKGDLHKDCDRLSIIPGTVNDGVGLLKLGLPGFLGDDAEKLAEYELMAHSRSEEIIAFLSRSEPLLKHVVITKMAAKGGVRSGVRSQGLEVLDQQQVLACEKSDKGIAIGSWPIEYWGRRRMPEMDYFRENDCYLIPAPTLVSQYVKNLFFAGRAISATERAIASARVIGTCLSTGYAAGMLAAELVKKGEWHSAIVKIRRTQVFAQED
ncbi:MAG: FAD-dependent oxidoreductase, partial [Thiotrichaceae bacterium]|nr:FAD-dependent oxidoreductase [Thiotrichaceae bacterium]